MKTRDTHLEVALPILWHMTTLGGRRNSAETLANGEPSLCQPSSYVTDKPKEVPDIVAGKPKVSAVKESVEV